MAKYLTALIVIVVCFSTYDARAQTSPYPASSMIQDIAWDFGNTVRLAPGSDLWPVTWASDGHVYTSWGDGGGFGGTNSDGRVTCPHKLVQVES